MKAYLNISGLRQEAEQLDQLCQQLQGVSTREEVEHLNTLLTDFASLDIKKSQAWCNSQDHSKKHIYNLGSPGVIFTRDNLRSMCQKRLSSLGYDHIDSCFHPIICNFVTKEIFILGSMLSDITIVGYGICPLLCSLGWFSDHE